MGFARRQLSWVICIWLASQIAGIAAAPVAFCCQDVQTADADKCCPGLLPGQICPMHHTQEGRRTCKMRNACGGADAAMIALAGAIGVLPRPTPLVSAFVPGMFLVDASSSALLRASIPESPPPRA